jgi:Secretion system C-terminal sorting domain
MGKRRIKFEVSFIFNNFAKIKKYIMKKILLLLSFATGFGLNAQVAIYDTTHASLNGSEVTGTANGPATSYGDAIKLAGTERLLNSITTDMFCLSDVTPFSVTISLYTNCPSVVGVGACGSGIGTLIFGSEVTVNVTPPTAVGTGFSVVFPYENLDISSEVDNTITVMIKASRNNVFWTINETPVIGSLPDGDTALSTLTRCGSVVSNNGCNRTFASPTNNNLSMKIIASPSLKNIDFSNEAFSISPNPASDFVTILSDNNAISNIEMTDVNGRIVKTIKVGNLNETNVNISDLSSGVYMMKITTENGNATRKIIKN